ncbi:L-type lectin-domain containing receptor kinase SIT2-like [Silene latifolia]|uniref:L-type lectin-domain containing receptor kinase SIT2-like n=1 Tax=Silene latifolia TaxID=37657 RepID=UPI003D770B7C
MAKFLVVLLIFYVFLAFAQDETQFIYNGFQGSNLHLDGLAVIDSNNRLRLTNTTIKQQSGHAFYPKPLKFNETNSSFSTSFIFVMYPDVPGHGGHGIAFVITPSMNFKQAVPAEYLGIFNISNNGLSSNHIFAVELDTVQNAVFNDIDGNHVGIDINGLRSNASSSAGYYDDTARINKTLQLTSGKPMQVWIDFEAKTKVINVSIAPLKNSKPRWSWSHVGLAPEFDLSKLPSVPNFVQKGKMSAVFIVLLVVLCLLVVFVAGIGYVIWRKMFEELEESWEKEYHVYRLSYKDLYKATKGFRDSELLGSGGFGKVYRGVLPINQNQVAVKRISHDSRQGMREFVAEIVSMRRLRHRNLVQLLGYCRRKGELLLVYEYMPNGSLDKFLFRNHNSKSLLPWTQRLDVIKGVASALLYLHEEWEQLVLHRDVKASNVLLDGDMNARLGDFGLARLYDHDTNPRSTHVVGTVGYLAPELSITGKPTTATDVFAFGTFILEVACGRRPLGLHDPAREDFLLVDWVFESWKKGTIQETSDPKLEGDYVSEEMELVLKLGLHCSHPNPEARPSMRQVVQFLRSETKMPDIPPDFYLERNDLIDESWGASSSVVSSSFVVSNATLFSNNSVIHSGR